MSQDAYTRMDDRTFNLNTTAADRATRRRTISADAIFAALLTRAIRDKKETAVAGTVVDPRPLMGPVMRGDLTSSCTGSPAAMCAEIGGANGGAETLK
jgi:hypothetical protein